MKHVQILILALFALLVAPIATIRPALANGDLVIASQESLATTLPRKASRKLVNIPELVFSLRAAIKCKGEVVSVTLSVADTAKTLTSEEFQDQWSVETTLTVPASQVALAASSRFCIADDNESSDELLVTGLATANASLRCENEKGVSMHYASTPLQVRLQCARSEPQVPPESSDER
jgi:hypothetical protein